MVQSASHTSFSKTYTVRQEAGDYEIPVDVSYARDGRPYQWPVKAWVTGTLAGEEVLNLALDTDFIQPGSENGPRPLNSPGKMSTRTATGPRSTISCTFWTTAAARAPIPSIFKKAAGSRPAVFFLTTPPGPCAGGAFPLYYKEVPIEGKQGKEGKPCLPLWSAAN